MSETSARNGGNRVVVITGASAGVGRAAAREFAKTGARIALLARGRAGLEAAAAEVRSLGGRALTIEVDVADSEQVEAAAEQIEQELGPIDVWVNNAMTAILARVRETKPEEFKRVTEVTYLGSVHGTQSALKRMLPRDRGKIVQVGSALGQRGIPLQATYCGAKHAIQGFIESLRTELMAEGSNVSLTIVQMPGLNTTQFGWVRLRGITRQPQPVAPIYQPEVAARAIVWAAEHDRRDVWVGVSTAYSIIGNRLASFVADRYLAATAISGQQSPVPASDDRQDYVFEPLDAEVDRGVHGSFDDKAHAHSVQFWLTSHRPQAITAAAGLIGAAVSALAHRD